MRILNCHLSHSIKNFFLEFEQYNEIWRHTGDVKVKTTKLFFKCPLKGSYVIHNGDNKKK